jgi:transposase-like protein
MFLRGINASRESVRRWFHRFSKLFSVGRRFRYYVAVDETVVKMHGLRAYVWSAVDVDSGEILAIYASWNRNMLIALKFLRMVLGRCINKPLIIVDRGPWYRWALERLGLKYRYQRLGLRNAVERFFGHLKQRTRRFYNNTRKTQSIEDYATAIAIIRNILTAIKTQGGLLLVVFLTLHSMGWVDEGCLTNQELSYPNIAWNAFLGGPHPKPCFTTPNGCG